MNRASLFFILIFLSGCASVQTSLKPETIETVKTIAIAAEPVKRTPQILDHTKIGDKRSMTTGVLFGLIGTAVEGAILSAEANSAINKSLDGDRALLTVHLKDYQIDQIINASLQEKVSSKYTIVTIDDLRKKCAKADSNTCSPADYIKAAKDNSADAFVYFRYFYGLAGYAHQSANAVIDTDMMVYDLRSNKLIFRKQFSSDELYNRANSISAFIENDGQLFKDDMVKAAQATATLAAYEWGLYKQEVKEARKNGANSDFFDRQGIPTDIMSVSKVDCKTPTKIEQDCSGLTGPNKRIKFGNIKTSIGGSKDGKVVMLMYGDPTKALPGIKEAADSHNVAIERATKFGMGTQMSGYILYSNGNLYSALEEYTY